MTESARIDLLIREGEGFTVEFKERFTSRIAEDMVAFANSRGGTIILGVRDDHTVAGENIHKRKIPWPLIKSSTVHRLKS